MSRDPRPIEMRLTEWLGEPVSLPSDGPDRLAGAIAGIPQQRHPWPTPSSRGSQRTLATLPALVVALVVVALGIPLLLGTIDRPAPSTPLKPAVEVAASPAPTPPASASPSIDDAGPRIDWSSRGIEFVADDLLLEVTDGTTVHRPVTAPGEVLPQGSVHADDGTFQAWWSENGSVQRLYIQLYLGKTHWWIDHIRAYDGRGDESDWIMFEDLKRRTRTPLGEPFVGDLDLRSNDADRESWERPISGELRLDGLRLSAFMPGTRPAPLTGCDYVVDKDVKVTWDAWPDGGGSWSTEYGDKVLQRRGEPLRGWKQMTPKEAEAALRAAGLCYRFDHSWPATPRFEDPRLNAELEGYSDRRCSAPETGKLTELSFGPDWPSGKRGAIVYLEVQETEPRDWPEPPPYGTDCPSQ